jgi:hypothetical protein
MLGERQANTEYPAIYYKSQMNQRAVSLPVLIRDWVGLIEMRHKLRANNAPVLRILVAWKKKS